MKNLIYFLAGSLLFIGASVAYATGAFLPVVGGTGTSQIPTYGQVLVGNGAGIYQAVATSTLGFSGSTFATTSINATYPIMWNTSTANISSVATSSLGLTVSSFASPNISQWTNNAGYITSVAAAPVSTSTVPTVGQVPYWTGNGSPSTLGTIATSSLTITPPLGFTGTIGSLVGGTSLTISCATCNTSNATVSSVGLSSPNSTLTIGTTPITTSGTITSDLNLAHSNTWTVLQSFSLASSSLSSNTKTAYFGSTATTTINADGLGSIKTASTGGITDTGLGISAGTFIAADPTGKLIATTTPASATPSFQNGILSITSNGGANAVSTSFAPSIIRFNWSYITSNSGTVLVASGSGTWINGTYSEQFSENTGGSSSATAMAVVSDTSGVVSGAASSNTGTFSGTISGVSSSGFTLNMTNPTSATPTLKISWEAEK